jgi:ketosteroid isomerase-like protein
MPAGSRVVRAALLAPALLLPAAVPAQTPAQAFAGTATAQTPATPPADVGAEDRQAIRGVIADQIAAFGRDDAERAFSHATAKIRGMFGTADRFIDMVRRGYEPVYRPREVEFLDVVLVHGRTTQVVYLVGPDGVPVQALYFMERQPDGTWRIDGCVLIPAPDRSA